MKSYFYPRRSCARVRQALAPSARHLRASSCCASVNFGLRPNALPAPLRPAAALGGAGADKITLHVCQAPENGDHQPSGAGQSGDDFVALDFVRAAHQENRARPSISERQADPARKAKRAPRRIFTCRPWGEFRRDFAGLSRMAAYASLF